mmetsp:Transcript_25564/g.61475  ORF Transcript_25564/g.61475 Transcript_25564/m.61475 type:complete len:210 (-) Transcript_25564:169-798(-)
MLLVHLPGFRSDGPRGSLGLRRDVMPLLHAPRRNDRPLGRPPRPIHDAMPLVDLPRLPHRAVRHPLRGVDNAMLLVQLPRLSCRALGHAQGSPRDIVSVVRVARPLAGGCDRPSHSTRRAPRRGGRGGRGVGGGAAGRCAEYGTGDGEAGYRPGHGGATDLPRRVVAIRGDAIVSPLVVVGRIGRIETVSFDALTRTNRIDIHIIRIEG